MESVFVWDFYPLHSALLVQSFRYCPQRRFSFFRQRCLQKARSAFTHGCCPQSCISGIGDAVHKKQMTKKAKRNLLVTLGIIFAIGLYFSPLFAKIIILIVAAGHFYYFLFRIKTVDEQDSMEFENECE